MAETARSSTNGTNISTHSQIIGSALPNDGPELREQLIQNTDRYRDNLAVVSMHQSASYGRTLLPLDSRNYSVVQPSYIYWTHSQLLQTAEVLSRNLAKKGTRNGIAVFLPSGVEWVLFAYAAILLQCPFVPLNVRDVSNTAIVKEALRASAADVLVVAREEHCQSLDADIEALDGIVDIKIIVGRKETPANGNWTSLGSIIDRETPATSPINDELSLKDAAMLVFTSGTTSTPKGTVYTSSTLSASIASTIDALELQQASKVCCHMPLHHIGGISMVMSFLCAGGSIVFPSASFSPDASIEAITEEKCTNLPCVPAMLQALAASPKLKSADLSSLRSVQMGATFILPEHIKMVREVVQCRTVTNSFSATEGVPVTVGYYDTESVPTTVSVGTVSMGARLRVCEPNSREPIARNTSGELHVGGPQIVQGYLQGRSSESFYEDCYGHWFITGDQGHIDDNGSVYISGRYKDLIIRGGDNIAPASIEAVFEAKLGLTAQVVGVRDRIAGELPVAVLQVRTKQVVPPTNDIREVIVSALGPMYAPSEILTLRELGLNDFPRTSSGKVRKIDLQRLLEDRNAATEGHSTEHNSTTDVLAAVATAWSRTLGINASLIPPNRSIEDFADSLTAMRLKSQIYRATGVELDLADLIRAETIEGQARLLASKIQKSERPTLDLVATRRAGPPQLDDILPAMGDPQAFQQIEQQVSEAIEPLGFTWHEDVEDVLPSWDLGHVIFGSVNGSAMVNYRATVAMKVADVQQLTDALHVTLRNHAMQRSFEVKGIGNDPPLRVIMRPNERWFGYAIQQIPSVASMDELTAQLQGGVYFDSNDYPHPSFQIRIAHVESTNTAALIWSAEHSAFDGLNLYAVLEDLDTALSSPCATTPAHVPYKLWADMYYSQRHSLLAATSVRRALRRTQDLPIHRQSIFPSVDRLWSKSLLSASRCKTILADPIFITMPDLVALRKTHSVTPFHVIKAALSLFLARKTGTATAVFGQVENGRSWPSLPPWAQSHLPDCMDVAGPTLERTVQIVPVNESTALDFMQMLKEKGEAEAGDVHAPWDMIRSQLGGDGERALFDAASMSTCLNYIPVRTENGTAVFNEMVYYGTRTNCESAWLYFCGIEGQGRETKLWTRRFSVEDFVSAEEAYDWSHAVMSIASWLSDKTNWTKDIGNCPVTKIL